jgi:erythromycin esterase
MKLDFPRAKVNHRALAAIAIVACLCRAAFAHVSEVPQLGNQSTSGYPPERTAFIRWAKEAAVPLGRITSGSSGADLAPLGKMIGDAKVVALSEGVHGAREPLEFRNRLLEYLVEEKGFTAIAIESGIVEGRTVYDYVRGGPGVLSTVLANGITWTMDRLPQNQALVSWLRQYNADPVHARKVSFYGFDVPGSPGNLSANRGLETPLIEALDYLDRVDSTAAAGFHSRLAALLPSVRVDLDRSDQVPRYASLTEAKRDALTACVSDLISLLQRKEAEFISASSRSSYEWGYLAATGAREVDGWLRARGEDGWLRQVPIGQIRPGKKGDIPLAALDARDRAQADNLQWILKNEGPRGKVLVFGHRYHLSTEPVRSTLSGQAHQQPMGTYVKRRIGSELFTVGNLIEKGDVAIGGSVLCTGMQTVSPASPESIDGLAAEVGSEAFFLDLRGAPDLVARWLDRDDQFVAGSDRFYFAVGRAFDALLYMHSVTPACRGQEN